MSNALKNVEKPEGKKPVGRYGHIQENVIKTGLKEVGCEGVNQIQLCGIRGSHSCGYEEFCHLGCNTIVC
jgi:hypothetical protein